MCSCDFAETPQFLDVKVILKSRKQHRCCECGMEIPVGSSYQKTVGRWDGTFDSFIVCCACENLRKELAKIEQENETEPGCHCAGPAYGWIKDDLAESLHWHGERLRPFIQHWPWAMGYLAARTAEADEVKP